MIPLELNDIINLANESSFRKGEDYYKSGSVKKIIKTGNIFGGYVMGGDLYKVSLDISDNDPYFNCNCPYVFGGICKHSVAFALAVINGEYEEEPVISASQNIINSKEFNDHYKNADTQKKLSFLKQLLDKDAGLQSQFVQFTKSKSENLDIITGVNIDEIRKAVFNELSSLDFDNIVENYDCYDEGFYNDDGYTDEVYDEISNVLGAHFRKSEEYFKKGNLIDGTRIILGVYEGIQNLPEIDNSDYYIFPDGYEEEAHRLFKEKFRGIINAAGLCVKSDEVIQQAFDLIIQRAESFSNTNTENKTDDINYDLKVFEKLFTAFLINKETAGYLYRLLQKNNTGESISMAFVMLRIAEINNDEQLWIRTAENFAGFEPDISMQLLEKYKTKNEPDNFNRIAKPALDKWADKFALYLIENIDKKTQELLYVRALKHYTTLKKSTKHYKILREYLNEEQRKEFVDKTGDRYNYAFYIKLLETEKRFADILIFAQKNQQINNDYETILMPIANVYPDYCFCIIQNKCNAALKSTDKNRTTYQCMAKWLKVMNLIVAKQKEAREYILSLYNHKPNLPALKDEMRKAGLI